MRALALLALVAIPVVPTPARADGFVELVGGVLIPVADDDWTNYVESGPKLGARIGSVSQKVGGMLSLDWSPINTDNQGWSFLGNFADISSNRFRILANVVTHSSVGKNLTASARFGAGIDISHVSIETNILGNVTKESDTDSGIALEAAGGIWFKVSSVELGGELAIPVSFHSDDPGDQFDLNDYSSFDIDLLFGVRLRSN
jgi:hypothetical protein